MTRRFDEGEEVVSSNPIESNSKYEILFVWIGPWFRGNPAIKAHLMDDNILCNWLGVVSFSQKFLRRTFSRQA